MRRLYRKTQATRQVSAENRLDALERRYIEPLCCLMPTVYCKGGAQNLSDGVQYVLGALTGNSYPVTGTGIMSSIIVANDPGDGTGVFNIWDNDTVQLCNGYYLMSIEAGVEFTTTFTSAGDGSKYALIRMINDWTPSTPANTLKLYSEVWELEDSYSLRLTCLLIAQADPFDPDTWTGNTGTFMPEVTQETGGGDLHISAAWYIATCLSVVEDRAFFP